MRFRSNRGGWVPAPFPGTVVPGRELRSAAGWTREFGRSAPLTVEVGFGKDTFLLDEAARRPDRDHVGIERDPHRARRFAERAAERGLRNVRALPVAAEIGLGTCLPDGAVVALHVYFPDPWPKDRHALNRMIRPWFARAARRVLAPTGLLHVATDDAPYDDQIVAVLHAGGFDVVSTEPPHDHATSFERLWRARGREIRYRTFVSRSVGRRAPPR